MERRAVLFTLISGTMEKSSYVKTLTLSKLITILKVEINVLVSCPKEKKETIILFDLLVEN